MDFQVNLLPGPIHTSEKVNQALLAPPIYHRSKEFVEIYTGVKKELCLFANSRYAQLMMGSGTLANDVVATQISLLNEPGLILSNGEFGNRLIDHGRRQKLPFQTVRVNWGEAFSQGQIYKILKDNHKIRWLWAAHCETSTGVLLDLAMAKRIASEFDVKLCLDCISSLGTIPIDLQGVYLATGTSSKGLGAFSGLSIVFHNHEIQHIQENLPRYLDLGLYAISTGSPFTFSSNLLLALYTAIKERQWDKHFQAINDLSKWIRVNLRNLGLRVLAQDERTLPAVTTIVLPKTVVSHQLGEQLEKAGYLLSYGSNYLVERNWIQIILMCDYKRKIISPLFEKLKEFVPLTDCQLPGYF